MKNTTIYNLITYIVSLAFKTTDSELLAFHDCFYILKLRFKTSKIPKNTELRLQTSFLLEFYSYSWYDLFAMHFLSDYIDILRITVHCSTYSKIRRKCITIPYLIISSRFIHQSWSFEPGGQMISFDIETQIY